jgi:hypothetical protein
MIHWIEPEHLHAAWYHVEPHLAKSVEQSNGDITLDEVKMRIMEGTWLLFLVTDEADNVLGCYVVSMYNRINARVAYIIAIAGDAIVKKDLFTQMILRLKELGATVIEGDVRPSVARLLTRLGFRNKSVRTHFEI